jgi:hypothetical protein
MKKTNSMKNILIKVTEALSPSLFKFKLGGKTYHSNCRTHFDVPYLDVTDILSAEVPPNILINIKEIFEASQEEFGNISFSILNASGNNSRIYVHSLIPRNTCNNIVNSRFILRGKENLLKSNGTVVHYIFAEKTSYNLTYSIELVPDKIKQLMANAISYDISINDQVKLLIGEALNKSLY